jgi:hypothetical protein
LILICNKINGGNIMASITNAKLKITIDAKTKKATCEVTASINFTPYEFNEIKEGLGFRLDCTLWGDDPIYDDHLYSFASKFFPDSSPSASEAISFAVVLPQNKLNEDVGKDEIYARLDLLNTYTLVKVVKKTNVISYSF